MIIYPLKEATLEKIEGDLAERRLIAEKNRIGTS